MNTLQRRAVGAAAASLLLLLAALAFQYLGGLAPCPLCVWQRWPHGVAVALGLLILVLPLRAFAAVGTLAMLVGAGIAGYHTGVEAGWWMGPASCVGPDTAGVSSEQLLDQILAAPVARCDEVAWRWLGLSMASWNALASLGLAALWARAQLRPDPAASA